MNCAEVIPFIEECKKEFLKFMEIESLASFSIQVVDLPNVIDDKPYFLMPAYTKTNPITGCHRLFVVPQYLETSEKALVFHELTHILDAQIHSGRDLTKHIKNTGFSEYHGKQVELLKRLGADSYYQSLSFSMSQKIECYGNKISVDSFLNNAYQKAVDFIEQDTFPEDAYMLKDGLGLVFNYLGCRSVCIMQSATGFKDDIDESFLAEFVGKRLWDTLKRRLNKRLDTTEILDVDFWFGDLLHKLMVKHNVSF